jgi:NADPH:quinone reductase-like Zn-dependent oxidoreductase
MKFVIRKQLKPVIDRVYPLKEIRAAHARLPLPVCGSCFS